MSLDWALCQTTQNKHIQSQHSNSGLFKSQGKTWRAGDGGGWVQIECGDVGMEGKCFNLPKMIVIELGISLCL